MEIAIASEQGGDRRDLGDACISETPAANAVFFGVADGFGTAGQARSTASAALELVGDHLRDHGADAFGETFVSEERLRGVFLAALEHANTRLYEGGGSNEDFVGSGTSLTAVLIVNRHAFVGHIGNARAYLLRFARLEALTVDDALFPGARRSAGAKSSMPAKSRASGLLWRSLGAQSTLEASLTHVDVLAGDQLLLCTDGVHARVSADEICGAMAESERACDAAARLSAMVKMRGGSDNGTVIVARDIASLVSAPSVPSAPRVRLGIGARLMLAGTSLLFALVLLFALYAFRP